MSLTDPPLSDLRVTSLRCEMRASPATVDVASPRLSWCLEGPGRRRAQCAYQVLVAASEAELARDEGSLWDSGRVASARAAHVEYAGAPLASRQRCHWKVRAWDEAGGATPWSEPSRWEMGLLRRSDWQACWIGLGSGPALHGSPPAGARWDHTAMGLRPVPHLRRSFVVRRDVRRARLYVTARGVYEVRCNGARVGEDVLAPGWTDYRRRIQYQVHDLTELVRRGENVLGAVVGDGWWSGYVGFDPKQRGALYGTSPQLLAQLWLEYEGGAEELVVTDARWRSRTAGISHADLLMGYREDRRGEPLGWDAPGFDDGQWWPVHVEEDLGAARLVGEVSPPVRVAQTVEPAAVERREDGRLLVDFGQNLVGWLRIRARGDAGTVVRARHAEVLDERGELYTENLRSARQLDEWVLRGGGEEVLEPRFSFHGFRFAELSGYPGEPGAGDVVALVVHSDTPATGHLETSDPMVNRLVANIDWGQRGNFISVPTDCPQRDERLGWLGDAQIFVRTATCNRDVAAFFEKWMDDVTDAQSPAGAFPDVAPRAVARGESAPAWADAGVIVPWTIYRAYGDTRIVERNWAAMSAWMEHLRRANPGMVWERAMGANYGDWLAPFADATPRELLATAYWAWDATLMAEMAEAIGRHEDAAKYSALFDGIAAAFCERFVDGRGRLRSDTQTAHVLALHMDLLPERQREAAAERLVELIAEAEWHLSTGFVGVGYLLPVLSEAGRDDVAYRLLCQRSYPSWGYTIDHGATTIWERWDGWTEEHGFQSPTMNSFNHYSLGSVGEWLYRYAAGIEPERPGYDHVRIRPHVGGPLTWLRAEQQTMRGRVAVHWRLEGGRLALEVCVPPSTTADVHVPAPTAQQVSEGGMALEAAPGVRVLGHAHGAVVVEVGSGSYSFSAPAPGAPAPGTAAPGAGSAAPGSAAPSAGPAAAR